MKNVYQRNNFDALQRISVPKYTMKISNQSDLMDFLKSEDTYGTIVNDITVSVVFGKLTSSNGCKVLTTNNYVIFLENLA